MKKDNSQDLAAALAVLTERMNVINITQKLMIHQQAEILSLLRNTSIEEELEASNRLLQLMFQHEQYNNDLEDLLNNPGTE